MQSAVADLSVQIRAAFQQRRYPAGALTVATYDDEGTDAWFTDKRWADLGVQQLRTHESALHFSTDEAFCYFLPAFMLAVLDDPVTADVLIDTLQAKLLPPKADPSRPGFAGRWQRFRPVEQRVIVAFLIRVSGDQPDAALEALQKWANLA
ncbi:hypothetical protein IGB42_03380 [Andreprevotia sp. IGB-42]|uniref:DUF6714 family protein n=1 Tax=Andreprevotia sp. IGB-42 TaxID=2497473 RepID=UPI0013587248|nr:DUF6714 family protein [Andreprevotia sp. IGB-42]KAF0812103.1 hypothetical protein IGB42_03380 [Andreprevotia sp. IGB-42]